MLKLFYYKERVRCENRRFATPPTAFIGGPLPFGRTTSPLCVPLGGHLPFGVWPRVATGYSHLTLSFKIITCYVSRQPWRGGPGRGGI